MSYPQSYPQVRPYRVVWGIDTEAGTPEEAARQVWEQIFGRTKANADDACVFSVEIEPGKWDVIDLSQSTEERIA